MVNRTAFLYTRITAVFVVACICTAALAYTDAFEWFYHHSRQHESYNYDEIVAFMALFLFIGLLWISWRLYRLAKTEIDVRKKAEAHLARMNLQLEERVNLRTAHLRKELDERKRMETRLVNQRGKVQALSAELSVVQEKERHQIATDLHDHIGQTLALASVQLGMLRSQTTSQNSQQILDDIMALIKDCIRYSRSLVADLSCPLLYSLTFSSAVECVARYLLANSGIKLHLKLGRELPQLPERTQLLLFKVIHESLVNIVKHAKARNVKISFRSDESTLAIGIQDDGIGFDASTLVNTVFTDPHGFGVLINRDRLTHLKGHYSITSKPGRGTHIALSVPVQKQQMGAIGCR